MGQNVKERAYKPCDSSMLTILNGARVLVYTMMDLMPSKYQQKSLRALLGLFLEATGQSLPQHCQTVSEACN